MSVCKSILRSCPCLSCDSGLVLGLGFCERLIRYFVRIQDRNNRLSWCCRLGSRFILGGSRHRNLYRCRMFHLCLAFYLLDLIDSLLIGHSRLDILGLRNEIFLLYHTLLCFFLSDIEKAAYCRTYLSCCIGDLLSLALLDCHLLLVECRILLPVLCLDSFLV